MTLAQPRIRSGRLLYHGTAAADFETFGPPLIYLAPSAVEARAFAVNEVLRAGRSGTARVLGVRAKAGLTADITDEVERALFNGGDVDAVIAAAADRMRSARVRYLEFDHPGVEQDFTATVSLFPQEDLEIVAVYSAASA
jgi:hypothetical protein